MAFVRSAFRVLGFLAALSIGTAAEAATIQMRAYLNGAQVPTASPHTGVGTVTFDTVTKQLSWSITFTGVTGSYTVSHFHGPAAAGVDNIPTVGISGSTSPLTGSAPLSASQEAQLLSGQWYVNIHSSTFPSGEIRGQVLPVKGDLSGDGRADLVWRHETTGANYFWMMNGTAIGPNGPLTSVGELDWSIVGTGDFDGDGITDLLWRHGTSGLVYMWLMNGGSIASDGAVITLADLNWVLAGAGDFDGDGKSDLLWRHAVTGQAYVWLMNGMSIASSGSPATVPDLDWRIVGVGDFDGDGKADIVWRHDDTGQNYLWQMNGTALGPNGPLVTVADRDWRVAGVGDLDGDGRADLVWRHEMTGQVYAWKMAGFSIADSAAVFTLADGSWKILALGDYDGDGRADILWRHLGTGQTYVWLMSGLAIADSGSPATVGDKLWTAQGPFAGQWAGLAGAAAGFEIFRQVVNALGANLAASHIAPLLDANYMHEGKSAAVDAGYVAQDFRGATIDTFLVDRMLRYDPVDRAIFVSGLVSGTVGSEPVSDTLGAESGGIGFKRQSDGTWKAYGNQWPGELGVQVEMRTDNFGPGQYQFGPAQHVNIHVKTVQNAFTSVTLTGGNGLFSNTDIPKSLGVSVDTVAADPPPAPPITYFYDQWFAGADSALTGASFFTFTLTPAAGQAVTRKVLSNSVTTGYVTVTSPTGHALADANLGNPLTVTWTLPGFTVAEVRLSGNVRTTPSPAPGFQCVVDGPGLSTSATSGQITLPNTCNGESILEAGINVSVDGVNGERTIYIYGFRDAGGT